MPMDAFFLYAERPEQPMHVGATCIFQGKISHKNLIRHIESRLHLIPRYQQRVVPAPFNIGHPTWENDPDFDLKNHIFRVSLKGAKDDEELRALSGKIFTGMLDRNKPLWEIYLVEGLEGNRTAMVFKVHHCMVDGVAGISLAYIAFDMTPEPVKVKKQTFKAPPLPDTSTLLYDALWDNAIDGIEHWSRFQRSVINFGKGFESSDVARAIKKFAATISGFLLPFTKAPFNGALAPGRLVSWLEVPFADARAIRAVSGGTVNDVILSALGTAVKLYMEKRGEKKKTPRELRVLVPVNVRQEHERAALGNRISFMPVEVPLTFDDPIATLHAVHINTQEMKDSKIPDSVSLMFEALQGMPAPMQAIALNGASNPMVQNLLSYFTAMPPGNMICTNVPGPNIPLYVMGKRLLAMYPKVPVVMEMGINLALTSYDQKLFLCFCADSRSGRDVEMFKDCFAEAFASMLEAAEVKSADYVRISRGRHTTHHAPDASPTPPPAETKAPAEAAAPAKKRRARKSTPTPKISAVKKPRATKSASKKAPAKRLAAKTMSENHVVKSPIAEDAAPPLNGNGHGDGNGHAAKAGSTPRIRLSGTGKK